MKKKTLPTRPLAECLVRLVGTGEIAQPSCLAAAGIPLPQNPTRFSPL